MVTKARFCSCISEDHRNPACVVRLRNILGKNSCTFGLAHLKGSLQNGIPFSANWLWLLIMACIVPEGNTHSIFTINSWPLTILTSASSQLPLVFSSPPTMFLWNYISHPEEIHDFLLRSAATTLTPCQCCSYHDCSHQRVPATFWGGRRVNCFPPVLCFPLGPIWSIQHYSPTFPFWHLLIHSILCTLWKMEIPWVSGTFQTFSSMISVRSWGRKPCFSPSPQQKKRKMS